MKRICLCFAILLLLSLAACGGAAPQPEAVERSAPAEVVVADAAPVQPEAPAEQQDGPKTETSSQEAAEAEPVAEPDPEPPLASDPEPAQESAGKEEQEYVLNTNTRKFHKPTCASVDDIKESNRKDVVAARDDLIAQGYKPCGRCKP